LGTIQMTGICVNRTCRNKGQVGKTHNSLVKCHTQYGLEWFGAKALNITAR
jgi:hypothetical protein